MATRKTTTRRPKRWRQLVNQTFAQLRQQEFRRALRRAGATKRQPASRAAVERALGTSKGVLCSPQWRHLVRDARRQGLIR